MEDDPAVCNIRTLCGGEKRSADGKAEGKVEVCFGMDSGDGFVWPVEEKIWRRIKG